MSRPATTDPSAPGRPLPAPDAAPTPDAGATTGGARSGRVGGPRTTVPAVVPVVVPVVVGLAALAVLGVLTVAALLGGAADPTVIGDPGPATRWGLLVSRTAYDVAAIGTLGVLLVAVVLLPRTPDGFGPDAARLLRVVAWWSGAWGLTALTTMLLTLSDAAGRPVPDVVALDVLPLVLDLETTRSLLSTAWLALLVTVGSRLTRSPATGLLLLLTAVGGVVLPLLTGHAGHGELPALTATSLALHVVAAAAWVGGLVALVVHLRRSEAALAAALPRFSRLALVCFVLVGVSGALTGWASLGALDGLWTSSYGALLLAKVVALGLLGLAGHRHRGHTIAGVLGRRPGAFVRLATAELVLMGCAAALAVALSHTAPPAEPDHGAAPATTVAAVR